MLKFDPRWRFRPPPDGRYRSAAIPGEALREFEKLIEKVATQGRRWDMLEHFKGAFCRVCGTSHVWSSSESWAETDTFSFMSQAAENAPLFLEAFYEACEGLRSQKMFAPDASMINEVCEKYRIGYILHPPELLTRESLAAASGAV